MALLLDTNVIAESGRAKCDPKVAAWMQTVAPEDFYLSAITVGEVVHGLEIMKDNAARRRLTQWWYAQVLPAFEGRVLPVDEAVAERWGQLKAKARQQGFALADLDGLIAATALVHGLPVVTRNKKHFTRTGVMVINPWE
ncbi:MAG: type II toxin-antitoxin system VapC family toxin [Planctomycetes bacterium]|nr:type II toxin-antitoxin system VapC family toxin [Planctomycetota bacterium]MCW8136928.1 type II toxin-antitoxin system VapC family toxin [Planctomycetota bacterium]